MKEIFQYFVEGEDERRLIEVLKTDMQLIQPGKIQIVNVVQEKLTDLKLRVLSEGTNLVFVFDTDTESASMLYENIRKAKKAINVKNVFCITQVKNIEDELERSTDIKRIEELLNSRSRGSFKRDFLNEKHLKTKLMEHAFEIEELWCMKPPKPFEHVTNEAAKVKNKKK